MTIEDRTDKVLEVVVSHPEPHNVSKHKNKQKNVNVRSGDVAELTASAK
jgi:hypothetical protein